VTAYRAGTCVLWSNSRGGRLHAHVIGHSAWGVHIRLGNGTVVVARPSNLRPGTGAM